MKNVFLLILSVILPTVAWCAVGDTFTAQTTEGVTMTFQITSETEKTCMVGDAHNGVICGAIDSQTSGTVTIPSSVNGYTVSEIYSYAFENCTKLTKVTIPSTVSLIGISAFQGCSGLESVNIPSSITGIAARAFENCTKLTSVTIPNNVLSVGGYAFSGCTGLTKVSIWKPHNIVQHAFDGCSNLTTLDFGGFYYTDGVYDDISIGTDAFAGCDKLSNISASLHSAKGLGIILNNLDCSKITTLRVFGTLDSDGFTQLKKLTNLEDLSIERATLSDGIPADAFLMHQHINKVTVGVAAIGDYAFDGCANLTYFNGKVSSLGDFCFRGTKINSLLLIGSTADCYDTEEHEWVDEYDVASEGFSHIGKNPCFGVNNFIGYKSSYYEGIYRYDYNIPNFTVLDGNLFNKGCSKLYAAKPSTNISLPNSVTIIADYAISGSSVKNLNLTNVTTVGDGFLVYCPLLEKITVNSDNTAFTTVDDVLYTKDMTELVKYPIAKDAEEMTIPASVTKIWDHAFQVSGYGIESLRFINVEATVPPTISYYTTDLYNSEIYVRVPYGCKAAYEAVEGWRAFKGIVEMPAPVANITFADANVKELCVANWDTNDDGELSETEAAAVTSLGEVFRGNTQITSFNELQYFTGLTTIDAYAFDLCSQLASVVLPEGLQTIGEYAFRESGLNSISFPTSLTEVGERAFCDCHNLTNIDFSGCSAILEYDCFIGCTSLQELYIPKTVQFKNSDHSWAWNVFGWCSSLKRVVFEAFDEGQQWSTTSLFSHCTALESVVLPTLKIIENGFFNNCTSLKSVTILKVEDDLDTRHYSFDKIFQGLDSDKIFFTVPNGKAETMLKAGYKNLSDLSGLSIVQNEFNAEVARIVAMADKLSDGDKTALTNTINNAKSAVNSAEDYATVYAQTAIIKAAAKTFLTTVSLPTGFDVTAAAITNPDFDQLYLGWNVKNEWVSNPNVNKRGWNGASYENGEVTINKFIDIWENTTLQDGNFFQTIKALPAGLYRLEADIIATNQNDANAEVTGVSLFAGRKNISVFTANEKPHHFALAFDNAVTQDVNVGIFCSSTNANWVAMDNVRLYYVGKAADVPQGVDLVSDADARVYLYNVDTGKYLSAGHAWGTHAILDETGLPVRLTQDDETGLWQIYFWDVSKSQQLLFDEGEEVYVDYNGQSGQSPWWSITQTGDGSYLIQGNAKAGTENYLGNNPSRQDTQIEYTAVSYTDIISTATVADNIHWRIFSKDDVDRIVAKNLLMATILRIEASGNVNDELLASAKSIYADADATLAAIIDATTLLNSQMGMPAEGYSIDMTALIINPRFENNTTEGWTGANVVGGVANPTNYHEQEFFQVNFNMYQTIMGVPNGRYLLKWKGFHSPGVQETVAADYAAGTDNASAVVYANNVQKTMHNIASDKSSTKLHNDDYEAADGFFPHVMEGARLYFDANHYADQLEVEVTDNILTIGVKNTENMGDNHWVLFSDFELYILENAEQMHNKFVASTGKGLKGSKAQLPILMDNDATIAGVQFKIRTPEGITVANDGEGNPRVKATNRLTGMTVAATQHEGYTQVLIYGIGKYVKDNSGAIANVTFDVANTLDLGDYDIDIYDIVLTEDNGLRIAPFSVEGTITLVNAEVGDANHDGTVDVADIIAVANYILGHPSSNFDETAANVNGDAYVDVADIIGIANLILHGNVASARSIKDEVDTLDPQ